MTSKTGTRTSATASHGPGTGDYITATQVQGGVNATPTQAAVQPSARVSTQRESGDVRVRTVAGSAARMRSDSGTR